MITSTNVGWSPRYLHEVYASYSATAGGIPVVFNNVRQQALLLNVSNGVIGYRDTDWKTKVSKKSNASLPYSRTETTCQRVTACTMSWYNTASRQYWEAKVRWIPSYTPDFYDAALDALALTRFKRSITSQRQMFAALAPVVELREFRGMCRQITTLALDTVTTLVNFKRTYGMSAFKYAAETWLGFSFAVAPLVSDLKEAAEAVARRVAGGQRVARISKSASGSDIAGSKSQLILDGGATGIAGSINLARRNRYRYVGGYDAEVFASETYTIPEQFGLGVWALPSTAWELIPGSWVADYVATVGDVLEDLFFSNTPAQIYATLSRKSLHEGFVSYKPIVPPGVVLLRFTAPPVPVRVVQFERKVLGSSLPAVPLRWKSADEMGMNLLGKLANMTSVLIGSAELTAGYSSNHATFKRR